MTCEEKEQEFLKLKSSLNREKRKIYYNNQTIEKIVNLTDHLIIFYWFFWGNYKESPYKKLTNCFIWNWSKDGWPLAYLKRRR